MRSYPASIPPVETVEASDTFDLHELIAGRVKPLLIKGLVSHWPMVKAAETEELSDYLKRFDRGLPLVVLA